MILLALAGFFQKFQTYVILAAGAAVFLTGAALYDAWIDDPAVRRAALKNYVLKVELTAAEARLAETQRQRNVAAQALRDFRERITVMEAQDAADRERHEQEIADYEKALATRNRSCLLDDADIQWLRKPQ